MSSRLSYAARETIKAAGRDVAGELGVSLTIAGYVREYGDIDGRWAGDSCGCPDDRCIDYHHDEHEECGCLPACLEELLSAQRAARDAAPIWAAHRGGNAEALRWAQAWAETYHRGLFGVALDELDYRGRPGITALSPYNELRHLLWGPSSGTGLRR